MLTFSEPDHAYRWNDEPVPGATELLNDVLGKPFYPGSAAEREANFARGTAAHDCCEFDDSGELDEATMNPALRPYLDGWRGFRNLTGWVSVEQEIKVFSPTLRVAGRIDKIGACNIRELRGKRVLCDLKTGSTPKRVQYQLAIYALLYADQIGIRPEKLGRICVTLPGDGKSKLDIFGDRSDLDEARALISTYYVRRKVK